MYHFKAHLHIKFCPILHSNVISNLYLWSIKKQTPLWGWFTRLMKAVWFCIQMWFQIRNIADNKQTNKKHFLKLIPCTILRSIYMSDENCLILHFDVIWYFKLGGIKKLLNTDTILPLYHLKTDNTSNFIKFCIQMWFQISTLQD